MATPSAVEDRVFVSAVEPTPEQAAASKAYFEAKGYSVETTTDNGEPPKTDTKEETPQQSAPPETPVEGKTAEQPPAEDVDEETRAEWQSANDGEKLGKYARRTKKLRELETANATKDGELAELRRQLEEARKAKPSTPASLTPPEPPKPAVELPKVAEPEPPKAKEFDKPEPALPKLADFADAEDPMAAYAEALAKHTKDVIQWNREKDRFESDEAQRIQRETQQIENSKRTQQEHQQQVRQKFADVQAKFPDFEQRTNGVEYKPMLKGILIESEDDGLDLGYHLADPANAEVLAELNKITDVPNEADDRTKLTAINKAIRKLAVFRHTIEAAAAKPKENQPEPPKKAEEPPKPTVQTPSAPVTPRREETTPTHVKARSAAPPTRLEDIDPMDSDARRRWKRDHPGQ